MSGYSHKSLKFSLPLHMAKNRNAIIVESGLGNVSVKNHHQNLRSVKDYEVSYPENGPSRG